MGAPTRAGCEVDLAAIRSNVSLLAERARPAELCAVVKADGYGHGLVEAARAALDGGAGSLAVAFTDEALGLRAAGVAGPLIALITLPGEDLAAPVAADVALGVGSRAGLDAAARAAAAVGRPAVVHLEADTGLARGGCPAGEWAGFTAAAAALAADGRVDVAGVWSHLACGDEPGSPVTARQFAGFADAVTIAERAGLRPRVRHLLNSGGLHTAPEGRYDMVRAGIACYGLSPGPGLGSARALGLRPAMRLRARVALTKRVPAGQGVSYGHRYRTAREATLALVPLGYGDGVPRGAGGRVPVLVGGQRRMVSGTVCMDQFVVDVGDDPVSEGDDVLLFGPGDDGEPTADEWAAELATIGYEVVTRVGARCPREYLGGGS